MRWFKLIAVAAVLAALISAGMLAVGDQLTPRAPTVTMCSGHGNCGGNCGGECDSGAHAGACPVSHAKVAKHVTSAAKAKVCPKSEKGQVCDPKTCKDCSTTSAKAHVCPKSEKGQVCDPKTCKDCSTTSAKARVCPKSAKGQVCDPKTCKDCSTTSAKATSGHSTPAAAKPDKA